LWYFPWYETLQQSIYCFGLSERNPISCKTLHYSGNEYLVSGIIEAV
jgi:hypothetical protein